MIGRGTVAILGGVVLAGVWLMDRTLAEQVRLKQARATFFSAVTHELKSPLASIRIFLETIDGDRVDAAKRGPEVVRSRTAAMLVEAGTKPGSIANLGHRVHKDTPIESVEALVEMVKSWKA